MRGQPLGDDRIIEVARQGAPPPPAECRGKEREREHEEDRAGNVLERGSGPYASANRVPPLAPAQWGAERGEP